MSDGGVALVVGPGARLVAAGDVFAYADMPRWEIQQRLRGGQPGWLVPGTQDDALKKFKIGYFVEWRIADRWKMEHFDAVELFIDSTIMTSPRAVAGPDMREALASAVKRPFPVVPFFDPGVWGGQWIQDKFDLPEGPKNYAQLRLRPRKTA